MNLVFKQTPKLLDTVEFKRARYPGENLTSWFQEAQSHNIPEYDAMFLATTDNLGQPDVRVVYLKNITSCYDLIFYTSSYGRKTQQIMQQPRVAVCFYWPQLARQFRGQGSARPLSHVEAAAYFATRHRSSQISTWASRQSQTIPNRQELIKKWQHYHNKFQDEPITVPKHWTGFAITLNYFEFWRKGDHRLHDRHVCQLKQGKWIWSLLQP